MGFVHPGIQDNKMAIAIWGTPSGKARIMCRHLQLNLDDLPWPVNVLKFNQALDGLQAGDDMIATVKDRDVVSNLQLLLRSQPDLHFRVIRTDTVYRIQVARTALGI